jgi:catechol 2,3-dioxygenase-like lactoylglutathione lyase family enzyme
MSDSNTADFATSQLIDFDNIAISVTNIDRSADWYERLFGFRRGYATFIEPLQAHFQILERDDMRIELLSRQTTVRNPDASIVPGPHSDKTGAKAIVFRTSSLKAVTAHLEREGALFEWKMERLSADGLRSTMVRDPDGTIINVLQYP